MKKLDIDTQKARIFLTNKKGGYSLFSSKPKSRFEGLFFYENGRMMKVLEEIRVDGKISSIANNMFIVKRKRKGSSESFFMPHGLNSLFYESNKGSDIQIILDVRDSYDNRQWGRVYDVFEEKGCIVVGFKKNTNQAEDFSDGFEEYSAYLAIKADDLDYDWNDDWEKNVYDQDQKRNSVPYERYVYNALNIRSRRLMISFSFNKAKAIREANHISKNISKMIEGQQKQTNKVIHVKNIPRKPLIDLAVKCCLNSMDKLIIDDLDNHKKNKGIFAGLPWFFQFWTRDEAISSRSLMIMKEFDLVKKILLRHISNIRYDGKTPNMFPESELASADGVGWVFKRVSDLLKYEKRKKILSDKERRTIIKKLKSSINLLKQHYGQTGLFYNGPLETWMDTGVDYDKREGFRIEIQALLLSMYNLAYRMTKDESYKRQEEELKKKVRRDFFKDNYLFDGSDDNTIRPNVFIAAYVYPDLLSKGEWTRCFKKILPKLWLSWGGLSTIDKKHDLFCDAYTGEDNKSYHRGDSWFFLNNMAALVMYRTDRAQFKKYIDKILDASTKEILYLGAIGHHSELSSAKKLESNGCLAQAWSAAMYIELIEEIF